MISSFKGYAAATLSGAALCLCVGVRPAAAALPSVDISTPTNGSTVRHGTIGVNANASGAAAIVSVQFKLDGANLGAADTTSPYWTSWNTAATTDGTHVLTAVVADSLGQTATSPAVSVEVANYLPQLDITSPTNDSAVAGTISVNGLVSSGTAAGISRVQFELDGANLGSADTTAPYSTSWNTTSATDGLHYLEGRVWDTLGNNVSSYGPAAVWVANALPTVAISAPANGSTVSRTISLMAGWTGFAGITSRQFNLDGKYLGTPDISFTLGWNTTSAADGTHSLTAVVRDSLGRTSTSTAVSVTVANGLPSVAISSPTNGSTVAGTISVMANASGSAVIASVQFKLDGANLGAADASAPYTTSWNTTSAAAGAHVLTAMARDGAGNTSTSTAVSVTVDNAPPIVSAVAATGISNNAATIGWTTNELGDTQVQYGTSTAYSAMTTLNTAPVTAHSQALSGLSASTLYHFRVRSRDAAGNLAVSADSTFTTAAGNSAPVITSALSAAGTIGTAFSYQITAVNSPTSFNATGLPTGLSVNIGGLISGTPTTSGTSNVTISAANSSGTGSASLTLSVYSVCDVNRDGSTNVVDVQLQVNAALGVTACTSDINGDGSCNVIDVQRDVNAVLGGQCVFGP
ncbi:MAG TPA: hypothetical protein DCZ01_04870 [Elusimicrobia bacterium]|nr:MAG: hypothetical protein A2X40_00315 [Elusimicrobia bacterium GWC2_65_9]HAZ07856.1 hypothetical protein [Elusimicrobiota bacterium]